MTFNEFKEEYKKLQTPEERDTFIKNRIEALMDNSKVKRIGLNLCGSYNGFISPDMGVCSNASGYFEDMHMDDMNVYRDFMNFIDNDIDKYMYGEPMAIYSIQHFIWDYFGLNAGGIVDRFNIYCGNEPVSIKELKGNDVAACSERSAMVQNLLKFLGFDSEIAFGKLNNHELHAYVIFRPENDNNRILYDPMNPVKYEADGKNYYCPGISMMSEEQYTQLKNGEPYTFDYNLVKKIYTRTYPCSEEKRVYTCDEVKFKNGERDVDSNKIAK